MKIDKAELLHIDCMAFMKGLPDKAFDLAIGHLECGKAGEYLVCADLILKGYIAYPSEQGLPYDVVMVTHTTCFLAHGPTLVGHPSGIFIASNPLLSKHTRARRKLDKSLVGNVS